MTRIELIKAYGKSVADKEYAEKIRKEKEHNECIAKITALEPRVKELIDIANVCTDNRIDINSFAADGITHTVGFMIERKRNIVTSIGIANGGVCGNINFYVKPTPQEYKITGCVINEPDQLRPPRTCDMKNFINQYDDFEERFYRYVDDIITKHYHNEEKKDEV